MFKQNLRQILGHVVANVDVIIRQKKIKIHSKPVGQFILNSKRSKKCALYKKTTFFMLDFSFAYGHVFFS